MSTDVPQSESQRLRWFIYSLLIVVTLATALARIKAVRSDTGETAALSANDRSRWATIRSLVDYGTYEIDEVIQERHPETKRRHWHSIDMVKHRGADGREHLYSSKPTLLPTIMAGEYWVLKQIMGVSISKRPFYLMRVILLISNLIPFGVYLLLIARYVERHSETNWGRMFVMTSAMFGTFLTTYTVTLNNHLPAAISVLITMVCVIPIWRDTDRQWWLFAIAGFFSAFVVANELPGLAFFCLVAAAMLWKDPLRTIVAYVPAAAIVIVAFFGTNYIAHQSLRPAYMHRSDGAEIAHVITAALPESPDRQTISEVLRGHLNDAGVSLSEGTTIEEKPEPDSTLVRYVLFDPDTEERYALKQPEGKRLEDEMVLHAWDNWYEYEWTDRHTGRVYPSYWTEGQKSGVDLGEPSQLNYALQVTIGHHGILSLTPLWILSIVGVWIYLREKNLGMRGFASLAIVLTCVVLAFYIGRPLKDRNYGGVTSGLRWMFWLIPLWLICLIPAVDRLSSYRWARIVCLMLLAASVFSATYSAMNPWVHPWIYEYWSYIRWINPM